ncbi:hypothetical protein ABB37_10060 [Leptomonas pyrrhocoris]|uniref:Uncharacterized protein n=1 Tax=Leptomonas pyrrhocoris TaxID=157538 RepID=A0A0N0DQG4_LEPPY|nr:hypothetical protein ABB37_10060 [Leptomonas pyrrhocoris]KPA73242.1 hypothetical protein ABB37_10060 [Leptomonas pyrrhocoris]|eukprot:XP_015651681.1 hypothetical protein ABB37_10060 [Leptomonas pyrrhocoris]
MFRQRAGQTRSASPIFRIAVTCAFPAAAWRVSSDYLRSAAIAVFSTSKAIFASSSSLRSFLSRAALFSLELFDQRPVFSQLPTEPFLPRGYSPVAAVLRSIPAPPSGDGPIWCPRLRDPLRTRVSFVLALFHEWRRIAHGLPGWTSGNQAVLEAALRRCPHCTCEAC